MSVHSNVKRVTTHTLQEMITIKSDDILGRASAFDSIIKGEAIKPPSIPESFNVLLNNLRSLALDVLPVTEEPRDERDEA